MHSYMYICIGTPPQPGLAKRGLGALGGWRADAHVRLPVDDQDHGVERRQLLQAQRGGELAFDLA